MAITIATAISAIAVLGIILVTIRRKPFYLNVWIPIVVNLLSSSGLVFCIGLALCVKASRTYSHGPPGLEPVVAFWLGATAACLFACGIVAACVLPPRAAWSKHSFIRAMTIAATIFLILTIIHGYFVLQITKSWPAVQQLRQSGKSAPCCTGLFCSDINSRPPRYE